MRQFADFAAQFAIFVVMLQLYNDNKHASLRATEIFLDTKVILDMLHRSDRSGLRYLICYRNAVFSQTF